MKAKLGNGGDLQSETVRLLRTLVARSFAADGVTREDIGKYLKIAKADVVQMVQGVKREPRK